MIFDYIVCKEIIKMNFSLYFISFVFTCIISTISSQDPMLNTTLTAASSSKGPGISSCYYFGSLDTICNLPVVPISSLPVECTSYFTDGIVVDLKHDVFYTGTKHDEGFMDELLQCGKPVYVRFGHITLGEWTQDFGCDPCSEINACDEMEGVIAYLNKHQGIAGLVLTGLTPCPCEHTTDFPNLSECLKTYITVLKSTFPNLQIAISISSWFIIDYYENPKVKWLDFTVLDSVVDFYEISLNFIELWCTAELRNTGPSPISGNYTYTLEKFFGYLPQTKIPQTKMYFVIQLNPTSSDMSLSCCDTSNEVMCSDPQFSEDWCSDTLMTYYEKGVLARKFGSGVIGSNVDFDDPYGCCNCNPFPSFHAVLNGFNCAEPPQPCPGIDRPKTQF